MEKKRMTLAQAETLLRRKGCTWDDHLMPGFSVPQYRVVMVPYDVSFGSKCWTAVDCLRHYMPTTYLFEDRKSKKHSE